MEVFGKKELERKDLENPQPVYVAEKRKHVWKKTVWLTDHLERR